VRRHLFTNHVQPAVGTHIAKKLELLSEISHKVLETIVWPKVFLERAKLFVDLDYPAGVIGYRLQLPAVANNPRIVGQRVYSHLVHCGNGTNL
jgi:hypothetical protein